MPRHEVSHLVETQPVSPLFQDQSKIYMCDLPGNNRVNRPRVNPKCHRRYEWPVLDVREPELQEAARRLQF